ncbi:MAG: hypothetical protein WD269_02970 [Acidimicrobiia bacterium]
MTLTADRVVERRSPLTIGIVEWTLMFLAVTATAGGFAMIVGILVPPAGWLDVIPLVDSWLIPGLVLGIGFGFGSLVVFTAMMRRWEWPWVEGLTGHHWSWIATILIGLGQMVWIGFELAFLPELSALQVVYGLVGTALFLVPFLPSVRQHLRAVPKRPHASWTQR